MPCECIKLHVGCTVNGSIICDYSKTSYIHKHYYGQAAAIILGYTYAGMVQVSQTNARPLGYTGMA